MKRTLMFAMATLLICSVAFAQSNTTTPALKTTLDSLSYQIGVANSKGLNSYATSQLGLDEEYMEDFYNGLLTVIKAQGDKKLTAYFAGIQIGQQISNQIYEPANHEIFGSDSTEALSLDLLFAGIIDGSKGVSTIENEEDMNNLQARIEAYKANFIATKYKANKEQSEEFIAKKAKEKGVKALPGGTLYKELIKGNGPKPDPENIVEIIYEGRLVDGTVFDSSNGNAVSIPINQLISSWKEALPTMPEGSKWELYIPYDQAYGVHEFGTIKPYSALQFTITLVRAEVEKKAPETLNLPAGVNVK